MSFINFGEGKGVEVLVQTSFQKKDCKNRSKIAIHMLRNQIYSWNRRYASV